MTATTPPTSLENEVYIGILSDINGDLDHLEIVSETMWKRGVEALVILGRLGLSAADRTWEATLDRINERLRAREQTLFIRDATTAAIEHGHLAEDGLCWLRTNIAQLPRGFRATLRFHATLATLDEAHSPGPVPEAGTDILIGPAGYNPLLPPARPPLDAQSTGRSGPLSENATEPTDPIARIHPKLYLGTHDDVTVEETVSTGEGPDASDTKVILLAQDDPMELSQGILFSRTSALTLFPRDDDTVTELTGGEAGLWVVRTWSSHYFFDLDRRTVARQPGTMASLTINDTTRRLRTIEACRVGQSGYWTMKSDGGYNDPTDFFWAVSTEIRWIKRVAAFDA
ncbi:hypothetical protein FB562_0455 [Homoserinimonas aerilata]|uniref:Calcineurin-like phosphoesterase family protein n=1 Tax=Homoserinimonas aerilata TaxID=1162970 RepID=A0A542YH22_9MICO|nr:hypothetical protein [Homoserinimonas aerilata]TQL47397.1 hypothetical protein FB562_0455 [Homoserinimonas aerilata]